MSSVKVIPASTPVHSEGPLCKRAKFYGIIVALCGAAATTDSPGWDGYVYEHPAIGESEDAYEAAEDCARAALRALHHRLGDELGQTQEVKETARRILSGLAASEHRYDPAQMVRRAWQLAREFHQVEPVAFSGGVPLPSPAIVHAKGSEQVLGLTKSGEMVAAHVADSLGLRLWPEREVKNSPQEGEIDPCQLASCLRLWREVGVLTREKAARMAACIEKLQRERIADEELRRDIVIRCNNALDKKIVDAKDDLKWLARVVLRLLGEADDQIAERLEDKDEFAEIKKLIKDRDEWKSAAEGRLLDVIEQRDSCAKLAEDYKAAHAKAQEQLASLCAHIETPENWRMVHGQAYISLSSLREIMPKTL
jgi:hypothetical protein